MAASLAACHGATGPGAPHFTHPTGDSIVSLALSGRPHGVAIAASGAFCVSQIDAAAVTCGTLGDPPAAPTFGRSVSVGSGPAHVAMDPEGSTAYTADQFGSTMSVVDVSRGVLAGTVPLSDGGFNLLVSPSGSRVYVTTASGTLHVVDAAALRVLATLPVGAEANGLAYDAARNVVYVSSISAGTITTVDAATNTARRTYSVGGGPQRIALSADGAELYIASQQFGLQVLHLADGTVSAVPGVPAGSVGLALSPDDAQLYVTNPPAGTVYIVDRARHQLLRSIAGLGSPRNVAFNQSGTTAVITDERGFVHFVR